MKSFIAVTALAATAMAAPTADPQLAGPVHPAFGDLVATKRGLRPLSLEGYSEDDNQDGFVDPIGQAVTYAHAIPAVAPLVHHAAPFTYAATAPLVSAVKEVKIEAPKVEKLEVKAPVVTYAAAAPLVRYAAAPLVHHALASVPVTYTHTVPVSRTYTQTVPLGVHRTVHTTHHVGAFPGAVVAAAAPAPEADAETVTEM